MDLVVYRYSGSVAITKLYEGIAIRLLTKLAQDFIISNSILLRILPIFPVPLVMSDPDCLDDVLKQLEILLIACLKCGIINFKMCNW